MLHYLVTYVRESLDRGSLNAITAGGVTSQPDLPATPKAAGSEFGSDASTSRLGAPPEQPHPFGLASGRATTSLLLLVGLAPLGSLSGCACLHREKVDANVVSARQLSLRGIDALERGQWDDAENLFASALQKNPADERAHRHIAEVMWHRGQIKDAIRHQEESVRLSGGDSSLLVELGEMYLQQGNVEAASECVDEAIDCNHQLCGAWALRGDIYRRRGEADRALECYHRALIHQPHFPHVQLAIADLYQSSGKSKRALATLDSLASRYSPEDVPQEVAYRRGLALKSLERYPEAIEALASATSRGEPTADMLFHLSEAQYQYGNTANARLAVQAALAQNPGHSASLRLRETIERQAQSLTAAVQLK